MERKSEFTIEYSKAGLTQRKSSRVHCLSRLIRGETGDQYRYHLRRGTYGAQCGISGTRVRSCFAKSSMTSYLESRSVGYSDR